MLSKAERIEGRRMTEAATKGSYAAIKREELLLHYDTIDALIIRLTAVRDAYGGLTALWDDVDNLLRELGETDG